MIKLNLRNIHGVVIKKPIKGPSNNPLYINIPEDSKKLKTKTNGFMLTGN